jgi:hypothetical protein
MIYLALASPFLLLGLLLAMPRFERFMLGAEQETTGDDARSSLPRSRTPRRSGGMVQPWS